MAMDKPCARSRVWVWHNVEEFVRRLKDRTWLGFAEVDIEIPRWLWPNFEEMCPFFVNKEIPEEAVPEENKAYLKRKGCTRSQGRKLVGALSAKMLIYAPLLQWYVSHWARVTAVTRQ